MATAKGPLTIGRDDEQASLRQVLDRALGGRACALALCGDAGIGKSALLRWARREAAEAGFSVLDTVGIEGDVSVPYAGLQELMACVPAAFEELDESGLLGAVSDGTVSASGARVAAAFLDVVTRLAERTPVFVVVDDAQWIDGPTSLAVSTLARRAEIDRVALVVSSRQPLAWWHATGSSTQEVGGLDERAALALLRTIADLDERRANECWRATGGNPLALIELGPTWGSSAEPSTLRLPERLERAIDERLAGVDDGVAAALLVAALEPSGDVRRLERATASRAIDGAVAARLLERVGDVVRFVHPLVRARVAARAALDDVRAAHRELAEAAEAVGDGEGALWHRAEGAVGPDERLAGELFELAQTCRRRGATREWLLAAQRASQLGEDRDEAGWRLADAVDAAWYLSDHAAVEQLYQEVRRLSDAPRVRGKSAMAYGQEVTWRDGPLAGYRFLMGEAEAIAEDAASQAAICAAFASAAATIAVRADLALSAARRSVAIATTCEDMVAQVTAQCALGSALQLVGDQVAADELLGPVEQLGVAAADAGMTDAEYLVTQVCLAHGYAERWERAIELVTGVLRRGRNAGALDLIAQANTTMTELALRTGRWSEAYGLIRTTIDDPDWGVPGERAWAHAVHARVCASLGREDECRAAAGEALEIAFSSGFTVAEVWARSALGLLELGAGRAEAALVQLDQVQAVFDASEFVEPGTVWWHGDQLDALVAVGDVARLKERVGDVEAIAERTGRRYALTVATRARAQLVDPDVAELVFGESIEHATALGSPFELARTHLARREHRGRHGLPGAADDGRRAAALFESLGAAAWAARAADHPAPVVPLAVDQLTASELRVAMAVARGLTNRQAAIELYLSTKTVDYYLQSIYRKLGVRTRTEMARVVLGASG